MRREIAMIENIRLRVTSQEKQTLRAIAARRGQSLSDFVRTVVAEAAGRAMS